MFIVVQKFHLWRVRYREGYCIAEMVVLCDAIGNAYLLQRQSSPFGLQRARRRLTLLEGRNTGLASAVRLIV